MPGSVCPPVRRSSVSGLPRATAKQAKAKQAGNRKRRLMRRISLGIGAGGPVFCGYARCAPEHRHRGYRDRRSGTARSAAVDPVSYAGRDRARDHLGARRAGGHDRRVDRDRAQGEPGAAFHRSRDRAGVERLSRRRGHRRAAVRLSDRSLRPPQAVHGDIGNVSRRHGGDSIRVGFLEFRAVPGADRGRDRRRVRGDQLGDPGADPGALSRPHRSRGQWQLLGRRGARRRRRGRAAAAGAAAAGLGLARGVRDRRGPGARDPGAAAVDPGEPALADAAWPHRRMRHRDRRHRAARSEDGRHRNAAARLRPHPHRHRRAHAGCADDPRDPARLPATGRARPRADVGAGVFLQRDLLFLCAGAGPVLRRAVAGDRLVHAAVRARQFSSGR